MKHLIMISALAISLASCGSGSTSTTTESTSTDSSTKNITPTQNGGGPSGDGAAPVINDSLKSNPTNVTDSAASVKSHSTETHTMSTSDKKMHGKMKDSSSKY